MKASTYPLLLCLLFLSACNGDRQNVSGGDYRTLTVQTSDLTLTSNYAAALRGRQTVEIRPQVSGVITDICIDEGDAVKKGQVLAVIDKRPYEAAVKQAEGNLRQAQAQLKIDQLQVERNRNLAKDDFVDKQTFDTIVAKVEVDKGQVEACQAALETAKINLGWCDITAPVDGKLGLYNIDLGNVVVAGSSAITTI